MNIELMIKQEVIDYLGSMENGINDSGEDTKEIKISEIVDTIYRLVTRQNEEIKFQGKEKIEGLIKKAIDKYENEYIEGYIKIVHDEEPNISRTEAKNLARDIIQHHLGTAYYKLWDSAEFEKYSEVDKELIDEYLDKECTRLLGWIDRSYITY